MPSIVYIIIALALVGVAFFAVPFAYRLYLAKALSSTTEPFTQSPEDPRTFVLVLGDSTGVGVGAVDNGESVAGRLGHALPHARIENCAKAGARLADVSKQLTCATRDTYDLVLLQVGANDVLSNTAHEVAEKELRALLEALHVRGQHVAFLSSGYIGDAAIFPFFVRGALNARTTALYERFASIAEAYERVYWVSLFDPQMQALFREESKAYLARDQFHPSGAGYGLWFAKVRAVLEEKGVWQQLR